MTEPTISVKGLRKLGFEDQGNGEWRRSLIDDIDVFISVTDEVSESGCISTNLNQIPFDSITYKQAKAIIEVFGTRF